MAATYSVNADAEMNISVVDGKVRLAIKADFKDESPTVVMDLSAFSADALAKHLEGLVEGIKKVL